MSSLLNRLQNDLKSLDQKILIDFEPILESNPKEYRGLEQLAKLSVMIDGTPTNLIAGFPESFPHKIPSFFYKEGIIGPFPHLEEDGFICFTRNESLILDTRYPSSILINCLEKVIEVIEKGLYGENTKDYIIEFESYWRRGAEMHIYSCINTQNKTVRSLNLFVKKIEQSYSVFSSEEDENIDLAFKNIFHIDKTNSFNCRCIYFPLKENTTFLPPTRESEWSNSLFKQHILNNLSIENQKIFRSLLKNKKKFDSDFDFVIVGLPTSNGNVSLFSYAFYDNYISIKSSGKKIPIHPFIAETKNLKRVKATVSRWHPSHMLNRTGGNTSLMKKSIMIVGLGSIGSEVAMRFAKAGVEKITLIDPDIMELDNVHRHSLGSNRVFKVSDSGLQNEYKVHALSEEIRQRYPFTKVSTRTKTFFNFVKEETVVWSKIDLVIIAIGSPNQEMQINKHMLSLSSPPPILYTWVEPLGIGGHVLVTSNRLKSGCYQCLFKPVEEDAPIYNRSAFAEPFQEFSKTVTGCGSVFTPYNFLDSERTAILTVETGLKILIGDLIDNPLLSWKGDGQNFKSQGYQFTLRFGFTNEELYNSRLLYKDPECSICLF